MTTTKKNSLLSSFEDAMNEFEKNGEKQEKRDSQKLAKWQQLTAQKGDLENKIFNQKAKIKKSQFDPSIDTVAALMDLEVIQNRHKRTIEVINTLFPDGVGEVMALESEETEA